MAHFDEVAGDGGSTQAPDRRLADQTRKQLAEAEEMAMHHRKQCESHRVQAEQAERVVKACTAALEVLDPPEKATYARDPEPMARY